LISISITAEAYQAIKATLRDGADSLPPQPDGRSGVRIWLANKFVNRLGALRGPGESYSDVIIRLAKGDGSEE
jgi:predicted CopG family antitoxin